MENVFRKSENLLNPIYRGNPLNDPQYKNQQGYNNYDLSNGQALSPRFGEVTPHNIFEVVPGDRHIVHDDSLSILNQIDANVFSQINQYIDYFCVPMRCIYPNNYEKIVPNPTKGSDIIWKALPQIPLLSYIRKLIDNDESVQISFDRSGFANESFEVSLGNLSSSADDISNFLSINNLIYAAYVLSRGQLLDYCGYMPEVSFDELSDNEVYRSGPYTPYKNQFQLAIDEFFDSFLSSSNRPWLYAYDTVSEGQISYIDSYTLDDSTIKVSYKPTFDNWTLSGFRGALYDAIEKGLFIVVEWIDGGDTVSDAYPDDFVNSGNRLMRIIRTITANAPTDFPDVPDTPEIFDSSYINPSRLVAYQLSAAEYFSNDSVDNVFTTQLWMQNLRMVMFPSNEDGDTTEPTFDYNGVRTEYDYFTTGAFDKAFINPYTIVGLNERLRIFTSLVFVLRRSLRYGDYFSTGRPDLLAVGQLAVPVNNGAVNPIDMNRSLVIQKFINAVNWVGSKFLNYMTSIFGVSPSQTEAHPVFLSHRKITLGKDTVTNTANDQGKMTTNLIGSSDSFGFDAFFDDFGVVVGVVSFDSLPYYTAGIDSQLRVADRYDMFNSMLQNVGDQPIKLDELTGIVEDGDINFAYTVRYAQYKFGISRAHGAFCNTLRSRFMSYPSVSLSALQGGGYQNDSLHINPDFIRDKPFFFDQFYSSRTGLSPATYYHFEVGVVNRHTAARKMQYQPPVL